MNMKIFMVILILISMGSSLLAFSGPCDAWSLFMMHQMAARHARSVWVPKISISYQYQERRGGSHEKLIMPDLMGKDAISGHRVTLLASWDLDKVLVFFSLNDEEWKQTQHRFMSARMGGSLTNGLAIDTYGSTELMAAEKKRLKQELLFGGCR